MFLLLMFTLLKDKENEIRYRFFSVSIHIPVVHQFINIKLICVLLLSSNENPMLAWIELGILFWFFLLNSFAMSCRSNSLGITLPIPDSNNNHKKSRRPPKKAFGFYKSTWLPSMLILKLLFKLYQQLWVYSNDYII